MTFIDFFSGIGGFRKGLELAGHKCIGFCEFDKYASASYKVMHTTTEKQREYLKILDFKSRQKEIEKTEYLNGESFFSDVKTVRGRTIPIVDLWTAGFPCQDISIAGTKTGFKGSRSSLFFEVCRLVKEMQQLERATPKLLLFENVKNLLSANGVTVSVIKAIGENLNVFNFTEEEKENERRVNQ